MHYIYYPALIELILDNVQSSEVFIAFVLIFCCVPSDCVCGFCIVNFKFSLV